MFERFTEKARRVIFYARYEASQYGSPVIDTEHLLLGLFREDRPLMQRALPSSQALALAFRQLVSERSAAGNATATSVDLPLSNEGKRVLLCAAKEAEHLNHRFIGTDHLLLGLLQEKQGVAADFLTPLHIDPKPIQAAIKEPDSAAEERSSNPSARYFGKYRGVVLNNNDPEQLGRLRVQVAALKNVEPGWALPCTPYPASGVPTLAVPPVGASVWVEFEGGDPMDPIWSGCFWNAGQPPLLKLP